MPGLFKHLQIRAPVIQVNGREWDASQTYINVAAKNFKKHGLECTLLCWNFRTTHVGSRHWHWVGIWLLYRPSRARICKRIRSPGIDSKEWILPGYIGWPAIASLPYMCSVGKPTPTIQCCNGREMTDIRAEQCLGVWEDEGKDDRKQNKFVPLHWSVVGLIVGCICRWLYGCCWFVTIMYISCIMPVILHRYCAVCAVNEHIIIISIHNSLRCCLPYSSNCEWYVYWALCVLYSMYFILYFIVNLPYTLERWNSAWLTQFT
jgi:hypothetical protein